MQQSRNKSARSWAATCSKINALWRKFRATMERNVPVGYEDDTGFHVKNS